MARLYSNNYSTTISTVSVGTGDTTFDVTSTTGMPLVGAGDYSMLTLTDSLSAPTKTEIVKATSLSGSTLTVTRAQEGTTAQTWASGDFVELRATALSFDQLDGTNINTYTETVNLSATTAIDRANGGIQVLTLGQAETVTIAMNDGESMLLHVENANLYIITWPVGIKWVDYTTGSVTANSGALFSFWKINGVIYGALNGGYTV